jgi:hypothetical protein
MRKRTTGLAAALALAMSGPLSGAQAAVPALGSREGELLCAGWTNMLASGAMLTTGGDAATAIRSAGVFLGRLSVIAPDARYRLQDFLDAYDKMTPADRDQLGHNCIAKLREIEAIRDPGSDSRVR